MRYYLLSLTVLILLVKQMHALELDVVYEIPVGNGADSVNIDREQIGLSFAFDKQANVWISGGVSNEIKSFDKSGDLKNTIFVDSSEGLPVRLHVIGNNLVVLDTDCALTFYCSMTGKKLMRHTLGIESAIPNKAYFYQNYLFIPQFGKPFPNENICGVKIVGVSDEDSVQSMKIEILGCIKDSYVPNRAFQFLPVDSSSIVLFDRIQPIEFKGQSERYALIGKNLGDREKECYHLYVKSDNSFRKLGYPEEKLTGYIPNYGWGRSSAFLKNSLYFVGVKYLQDIGYKTPKEIVLSKVQLDDVVKMPVVSLP